MLTLQEYKAANQPSVRRQAIRLGVLLGFFLILLAATFSLGLQFKRNDEYATWFVENVGGHFIAFFLLLAGCVVILLLLGSIMWFMCRTDRKDARLYCPHCRKRLNRAVEYAGHCSACGETALVMPRDPAGLVAPEQSRTLPTVAEFNSACTAEVWRGLTQVGFLFLGLFIYIGAIGTVVALWREPIFDWITEQFQADRPQDVFGPVTASMGLVILFGGFFVVWLMDRKRPADPRIVCLQCRTGLLQVRFWIVATQHCPRCATEVLADPDFLPPNISDRQSLTDEQGAQSIGRLLIALEDFRADILSYRRWIVVL
jgi:hypothetical protein